MSDFVHFHVLRFFHADDAFHVARNAIGKKMASHHRVPNEFQRFRLSRIALIPEQLNMTVEH